MTPDIELLTQYVKRRDEATFAELVRRHLDHVYSTALRLVSGDAHLAEDVCQLVFADLARKADSLANCNALSSWLHVSARFAAAKLVRTEQRRRQREQATLAMPSTTPNSEPDWDQVRPILDETIAELDDADRDALSLRYFEKKPFTEVGSALGVSENAARMRVDRAVDKLRSRLALRGITSTLAALGTALAQEIVAPAPAALGAKIVGQTMAGIGAAGVSAGGFTLAAKLGFAALAIAALVTVGILAQPKKTVVTQEAAISAAGGGGTAASVPETTSTKQMPLAKARALAKVVKQDAPVLHLVDKSTGAAIPDQTIGLLGWARGSQTLVEKKVELKDGQCVSPFDPNYMSGDYWIITHVEGYADTRLRWVRQRGDVIPDAYTVELVPPVLLHGTVVDPQGSPVAEASVEFGCSGMWESETGPEDHRFDQVKVTTDAQGHWEMNRIAEDVLPFISGDASHPKYSRVGFSPTAPLETLAKLRDGSYVFQLGVAGGVVGRVVNTNGEPITNALVRAGYVDEVNSRTTHTDENGMFELTGCKPGDTPVTASMKGYAPAVISVNVGSNSTPISLTLTEGKTLRLRVVDAKGRPIKKASVWYASLDLNLPTPLPQVEFQRKADEEGRIVWEHAPDQALPLQFSADGYLEQEHETESIRPDDSEHVITLSRALFISGTVRDADSGDLLPKFRLSIGTVQPTGRGDVTPWWSPIDRFNPLLAGGQFRKSLDEPVIGGTSNLGYIFRFSAEGYKPEVTRLYQPDEGAQELDINLHKAKEVQITVYRADGTIAIGAQAGLMAPGVERSLGVGRFTSMYGALDPVWIRTTDASGQFMLPDDDGVQEIAIVDPSGFVSVAPNELRKAGVAHLQPWARVQGVVMWNGRPLAKEALNLMRTYSPGKNLYKLDFELFRTETDAEGRFEFAKVPPGAFQVMRWVPSKDNEGRQMNMGVPIADFELKGGETNELTLDADVNVQVQALRARK
ncbi:MAG TPA: sigma-70 family RNA polymerase sigma factor [Verrucomicrobiae bacterium]|jgi:RNA polymerase sigma factor (sigma-70 family)|nr:sigma-70 family RNA polymerase sigma factor [Verrucomicrobiae bacterium]